MATTRATLTDEAIMALQPRGELYVVWDVELIGLGVEVVPDGEKTFILEAAPGAEAPRVRLGAHGPQLSVAAARERAGELLRRADQPPRQDLTVAELCDLYLAEGRLTRKPAPDRNARAVMKNHVKPVLGWKLVAAITANDGARLLAAVAEGKTAVKKERYRHVTGGRAAANAAVKNLSAALTFAARRGLCPSNPLHRLKKFPRRRPGRALSDEEYARLGQALAAAASLGLESPYAIAGIKLLMLTGSRRKQIEALTWESIDRDASCLKFADTKTGPKSVPTGPEAFELIASVTRRPAGAAAAPSPYVFPAANRNGHFDFGRPWKRIRRAAGLEDLRMHDLRHAYASVAIRKKETLPTVGRLLGHSDPSSTQIYAHAFDDDAVRAATETSDHIARVIRTSEEELLSAAQGAAPAASSGADEDERFRPFLIQAVARRWLSIPEAAVRTGLAAGTLQLMRAQGHGPPFCRVNGRVLYDAEAVDAWIEVRRTAATMEQGQDPQAEPKPAKRRRPPAKPRRRGPDARSARPRRGPAPRATKRPETPRIRSGPTPRVDG